MKFKMDNGTVIDTRLSRRTWEEDSFWDGSNHISVATGSQFDHQQLYESRRGRYYLRHWSNWQGTRDHVEWVSPEEAARWLIANEHELPEELVQFEDEIVE